MHSGSPKRRRQERVYCQESVEGGAKGAPFRYFSPPLGGKGIGSSSIRPRLQNSSATGARRSMLIRAAFFIAVRRHHQTIVLSSGLPMQSQSMQGPMNYTKIGETCDLPFLPFCTYCCTLYSSRTTTRVVDWALSIYSAYSERRKLSRDQHAGASQRG